jgi:hypothetical protein
MEQQFDTFLFRYRHAGVEWELLLQASDANDARERIKSLAWARYDGRLVASMPAALGWIAIVAAWLRNFLRAA